MSRRNATIFATIALVAVLATIGVALRARPTPLVQQPTATAQPRPETEPPPMTNATAAPIVVQRMPARGEELRPDGALALVFDRAMDHASVEAAFQLQPSVAGQLAWPDARTVVFQPAQQLPRAAQFAVALGPGAQAQDGAKIADPLRFQFATSGFLEVGQVVPADAAQDVATGSTITVMFSRPVVALTTVEQQTNLPQPLSFTPALAGSGAWLNSAIYLFTPSQPLQGGTRYTGRVDPSMRDADGNPLENAFTWQFSSARPQISNITPADGATGVSVVPTIRVQFNQPIDANAAQQAFSLRNAGGANVPIRAQVLTDTLLVTPTERLAFDGAYRVELAAGMTGASGGAGLANSFSAGFRTAPLPKVVRTEPADGAKDVNAYTDFAIVFNAPIDLETVMPNLVFTPQISVTQVYTYFDTGSNTFHVGLGAHPSTDFAIQIGPDIADAFGNTTGQTLDVRFRTAPLPPNLMLIAPNGVATYDSRRPARIGISATNASKAALSLYRLPNKMLEQPFYRAFDSLPNGAQELRTWTATLDAPLDAPTLNRVDLLENSGPLEPGVYLVRLDSGQNGVQSHLMVVAPINLTLKMSLGMALIWANDIATGAPVPNLTIDLYENGDQVKSLGSVTTDADGVAQLKLQRDNENGMTAVARGPFAAMSTDWGQSISRWEFGANSQFGAPGLYAYAYTDRPIYRPGQQVHFKGLVRNEDDAHFRLSQQATIQITIQGANGEQVYTQPLQISANGTFDGDLTLSDNAALGQYQLIMELGDRTFNASFQVAAYRAPEFEVDVAPQQAEALRGTPTSATVDVKYLFGGPVANAPVTWNVLADAYRFAPDWATRFQFGEDSGGIGRCWECWWQPAPPPMPILSGSGTTDAQGKLTITVPAGALDTIKNANQEPSAGSYTLTVEAVATGRDNQAIAGRSEIVVHAAEVYVGLAAQTYLGTSGKEQKIDIVTADTAGRQRPNQPVAIEFQRVTWDSRFVQDGQGGRWESTEKTESVGTQAVTTDGVGQASAAFTPTQPGAYRAVARARDATGREAKTTLTLWVAGDGYIPWQRDSSDRITLVADKASYTPGETATILIPSPFQGPHWALITVERAHVQQHEVRRVTSNSIVYKLPITADHAPNVYVSVVLFSGGPGDTLADYKAGVLPITVEPAAQTLNMTLTPSAPQTAPGAKASFGVQVTDAGGQPVAAELSLDMVDKGVLSLAPRQANEIRETLYGKRALGVTTASGIGISGDRTQEQINQATGGRGGGDSTVSDAAPMATTAPALEAAPAAGQAERAVQQASALSVRENFADTAYWNQTLTTDASGKATVELTLPDNLTTWVLRGVGLTGDTRVGEGTVNVVATKPLLVRPVTPRFFVAGDTAALAANVSNNTDAPLDAQVALAATGMTVTGVLTQTITVPARGEAQVTWNAIAQDVAAADLIFSATAGQYSDASKPRGASGPNATLPIYRYSAPEIVGTGGQLAEAGARTEVVALPPNIDQQSGELTVRLDPSLAAGMRAGLSALEHYEYDCAEQTVSRFLPNMLTARALHDLGVPNAELEARLPKLVADGIAGLASQQNGDGGWGWCLPSESNTHVSAYVVFGLARARTAGYTVPDDVLSRGQDYLASKLMATGSDNERVALSDADANQQAWLLFVLGESGRADAVKAGELFTARAKLANYARALLAMALQTSGAAADDARIKALLADLNTSAILSATGAHWEEQERDYWSMNTDTRTSAIVLEALARLDPQNQINPNVVRWLMVARQDGAWATTQETAWSLLALTDWMAQTGELKADYDYGVQLNGAQQAAGHIAQADLETPITLTVKVADLLRDAGNRLTIGRGGGPGRLYYTAHLRAFLPVPAIKALDRGVIVRRRYTLASCADGPTCPEVREAKVGDVLRVELSIIAPSDLHYLAVEDPLPAGFEAIDPNLATTSQLAQPPQTGMIEEPSPLIADGTAATQRTLLPWWNWHSRVELRDNKVALFADRLSKGAYLFSYTIRATQAGIYRAIPTTASEMYFPEVYGRSDGAELRVEAK